MKQYYFNLKSVVKNWVVGISGGGSGSRFLHKKMTKDPPEGRGSEHWTFPWAKTL